jgi:hypothetical protein
LEETVSTIHSEPYQSTRRQDTALQHLTASREEIILLTHLLQASLVNERSNPLRRAVIAHPQMVRSVTIMIVILLSVAIGLLAPEISRALMIH